MLESCLEALGKTVSDAILVGDSEVDEQAALNAGISFIGVRYGYGGDAISDGATTIEMFSGLPDAIHRTLATSL